jgi:transposase-like protein
MTGHLNYEKHAPEGHGTGNSRNGKSGKMLKGNHREVEIDIPVILKVIAWQCPAAWVHSYPL